MVKGVIFDMDGTMFDTECLSTKGWARKRITDKIESDCHAAFTGCGQFFLHMSEKK